MDDHDWLAERFEAHRAHLRAVAYRMLGSLSEADDALQESWLRLSRADTSGVENLGGWLTTVVARVCLNLLRSRQARRDVVLRADRTAVAAGGSREVRGAAAVAAGALTFSERARFAQPALVNGTVGVVVAPRGRLFVVLGLTITGGKIVDIDVVADPERLRHLDLAVLDE